MNIIKNLKELINAKEKKIKKLKRNKKIINILFIISGIIFFILFNQTIYNSHINVEIFGLIHIILNIFLLFSLLSSMYAWNKVFNRFIEEAEEKYFFSK